jgi:hypothetical protein
LCVCERERPMSVPDACKLLVASGFAKVHHEGPGNDISPSWQKSHIIIIIIIYKQITCHQSGTFLGICPIRCTLWSYVACKA